MSLESHNSLETSVMVSTLAGTSSPQSGKKRSVLSKNLLEANELLKTHQTQLQAVNAKVKVQVKVKVKL